MQSPAGNHYVICNRLFSRRARPSRNGKGAGFQKVVVMTKWLLFAAAALVCASAYVLFADSEEAEAAADSYGRKITYEFDSGTGTLTISGSGDMGDSQYSTVPWKSYRESIKTVVIGDGFTSIGSYAFSGCTALASVTIPNSVT